TGNFSVPVFDPRITPGGDNGVRWVTEFIGNAAGQTRLKGCKFTLERSLDGGASFDPYFAGRVRNTSMSRPLWWDFDLKDSADDLNRKIFVGSPQVSYAFPAALVPVGVPEPFANFEVSPRLSGALAWSLEAGVLTLDVDQLPRLALVTKAAQDAQQGSSLRIVKMTKNAGADTGYFLWVRGSYANFDGTANTLIPSDGTPHYRYSQLLLSELPVTDPRYTSRTGWSTDVACYAFIDGPPSPDVPLLVGDVHPVQYLADIVDGKFSVFPGTNTVYPLVARETTSWAALLADPSFGTMRDIPTAATKANDYAEKYILQRYNLAWRINGDGEVVLIDLRRTSALASAVTLTDADLVADVEPTWADSRDGAITAVQVTYYLDATIPAEDIDHAAEQYPALPTTMIRSSPLDALVLNDLTTFKDVGEKIVKIDARGSRAGDGEFTDTGKRIDTLDKEIRAAVAEFLKPFGTGTITVPVTYRAQGNAASVYPGTYAIVQHTKLPDPATNERGGGRLVLCLSRDEQDGRIAIQWIDFGADVGAASPTVSSIAIATEPNAVDVDVTLNASSDPVEVGVAITADTVVVRPAQTSSAWVYGAALRASGIARVGTLPSGFRIWARARSQASTLARPSAWVFPAGAGYVDLTGPAPSAGLTASNIYANRVDLAWSAFADPFEVEVFQTLGSVPAVWTDDMLIQSLRAGTMKTRVGFLAPLTGYAFGVRVRDVSGGPSAMATLFLTTTNRMGIAPQPVLTDSVAGLVAL
ncbi:MAG: hypothetical protein ABIY52_13475, partial [Gemmatimonadaceae bacterium]